MITIRVPSMKEWEEMKAEKDGVKVLSWVNYTPVAASAQSVAEAVVTILQGFVERQVVEHSPDDVDIVSFAVARKAVKNGD